uniref:NR LBD domain-containing protein n=1 Tax=Syphacia muris TaxID=451379 RepID=A0A0N5AQR6_9BILA
MREYSAIQKQNLLKRSLIRYARILEAVATMTNEEQFLARFLIPPPLSSLPPSPPSPPPSPPPQPSSIGSSTNRTGQ